MSPAATTPMAACSPAISANILRAIRASWRLNWIALNTLTGTKFKLLTGYEGPATAKIAMERGEVEAVSQPWSVIKAEHGDWLREKKVNLLLQTGEANSGLEHLPRMVDLARNEENRRVLEIFTAPTVVGRAFAVPPGVARERVEELRSAFTAMVQS